MDHKTNEFMIQWASLKLKMFAIQKMVLNTEKISHHPGENVYKSQADKDPLSRIFMERTLNTLPGNNNKKYNTK